MAAIGEQIVDTFFGNPNNGDPNTGSIVSPEFTINRDFLDFEIAGGNHPEPGPGQTAVNLVVDGAIVRTATGSDSGTLNWRAWDVKDLAGKRGAHRDRRPGDRRLGARARRPLRALRHRGQDPL